MAYGTWNVSRENALKTHETCLAPNIQVASHGANIIEGSEQFHTRNVFSYFFFFLSFFLSLRISATQKLSMLGDKSVVVKYLLTALQGT